MSTLARIPRSSQIISLVHETGAVVPPVPARPLGALSPLERALVAADLPTVKALLLNGAEPDRVCAVRLGSAAEIGGEAAACARLIQVAVRMKRMNLAGNTVPASAGSSTAQPRSIAAPSSLVARFAGCFSAGPPQSALPKHDGPITKTLRQHDLSAATKALEKAGPRPSLLPERRLDQIIGMLALNDRKALENWHRRGLLENSRANITNPDIKTALKQFSYLSLKPGRSRWRWNNDQVKFSGSNEKIVCRHLAVFWLMNRPVLENGKIDYTAFADKKRLKKAFSDENEDAFGYYQDNCTNAHLVENTHWGKFLATQFREMQHTGSTAESKRILITSDNHAMACELKIKPGADGNPTYALNFYDPNMTASHRRVRTQDLATIESISMANLINHPRLTKTYYKNQTLSMAYVLSEKMPHPVASDSLAKGGEYIANRQLSSRPAANPSVSRTVNPEGAEETPRIPVNANYLYTLMSGGFSGELSHAFAEVRKIPDSNRQAEILAGRSSRAVPAFLRAISLKRITTIFRYTEEVLASPTLSSHQKAWVLSQGWTPKREDGMITPLWKMESVEEITPFALMRENLPAIAAKFHAQIMASQALSPDDKANVLRLNARPG